jgi:hypothetical protein
MGEHEHVHASQPSKIKVRATIDELFELQNDNKSLDKPRKLINKAKISASDEVIALLPSYEALRQRLARKKVDEYAALKIYFFTSIFFIS